MRKTSKRIWRGTDAGWTNASASCRRDSDWSNKPNPMGIQAMIASPAKFFSFSPFVKTQCEPLQPCVRSCGWCEHSQAVAFANTRSPEHAQAGGQLSSAVDAWWKRQSAPTCSSTIDAISCEVIVRCILGQVLRLRFSTHLKPTPAGYVGQDRCPVQLVGRSARHEKWRESLNPFSPASGIGGRVMKWFGLCSAIVAAALLLPAATASAGDRHRDQQRPHGIAKHACFSFPKSSPAPRGPS